MNIRTPKSKASLAGLSGAILGCLALSAVVQAGSRPSSEGRSHLSGADIPMIPASSYPEACVLFRDGFELAADPPTEPPWQPGDPVSFVTSGGYTIRVNLDNVTITDPFAMNKLVHSGTFLHEYLNGKHIKDWGGEPQWDDARRSLILGDGTKVTMAANDHSGTILQTSIYDGDESLQIDNSSNTITHHGTDPGDSRQRDQAQYDGETATFQTDAIHITASYSNAYDEDENFNIINIATSLGATGGCANPHQVNDYYDDPRRPDT